MTIAQVFVLALFGFLAYTTGMDCLIAQSLILPKEKLTNNSSKHIRPILLILRHSHLIAVYQRNVAPRYHT